MTRQSGLWPRPRVQNPQTDPGEPSCARRPSRYLNGGMRLGSQRYNAACRISTMAQRSLLPAPYIAGRFKQVKNADKPVRLALFVLFVLMPLAYMGAVLKNIDFEFVFLAIWLLTGVLAMYAEVQVKPKAKLKAFHYLSLGLVLIGVPGLAVSQPRTVALIYLFGFIGVILIKLIVVLMIIPRCLYESNVSPVRVLIRGLLTGALLTCVINNVLYAARGVTILTPGRALFTDWFHPNAAALYGSITVLAAIIEPNLNKWYKAFAIGTGFYTLLVTQGRSSLFSTLGILAFLFLLELVHDPKKYAVQGMLWLASLAGGSVVLAGAIRNLPAIKNIEERTFQSDDPLAGRLDYIEFSIEYWSKSQLIGFGQKQAPAVDSFWMASLMQYGILGLFIYVVFYLVSGYRGYKLFTSKNPELRLLGKFIMMVTLSFFVRSFTDDNHALQLSNIVGNVYCIAVGLAFLVDPSSKRWMTQETGKLPVPQGPTLVRPEPAG